MYTGHKVTMDLGLLRICVLLSFVLLLLLFGTQAYTDDAPEVDCNVACSLGQYDGSCSCFRSLFRWGKRSKGYYGSDEPNALERLIYYLRSRRSLFKRSAE